jgi:hypothetical protein
MLEPDLLHFPVSSGGVEDVVVFRTTGPLATDVESDDRMSIIFFIEVSVINPESLPEDSGISSIEVVEFLVL